VLAKAAAASVDDVGAAAGRASAKAAGVIVDDTAVTPRYVQGLSPSRELPIIKKIAIGSLRNKLLLILPAALLLSQFLPVALTPLLMLGGTYLCFEGVEKIWERVSGHPESDAEAAHQKGFVADEGEITSGAIRTDFILSAEIMVISLNEVADEPFITRAAILVVVALAITALVYGVVALIVKMDDVGLHLSEARSGFGRAVGRGLVRGMPALLTTLSAVGIAAMIWVGGHILLLGFDELGLHAPYSWVHHAEEAVHDATGPLGGILAWVTNTLGSAILGLIAGAIVVAVLHVLPFRRGSHDGGHGHDGHQHPDGARVTPAHGQADALHGQAVHEHAGHDDPGEGDEGHGGAAPPTGRP
jgi:predicted DNA repair protein MutK